MTTRSLDRLLGELHGRNVRYVLIGVGGANYFSLSGSAAFKTYDRDLFLPPDPPNLLRAWQAVEALGLELTCGGETLDYPRDLWLAEQVVRRRALTRTELDQQLTVDLTLVMAGFEFEQVWNEHRTFTADGVPVRVARLTHIVTSKALAGRDKDHLFFATHKEALQELLGNDKAPRNGASESAAPNS
jgi:hypothetical protein